MPDLDALFEAFVVTDSITIDAPIARVWDVVSDVERMTEFSPELIRVEWLGGASRAAPGARFAGTSSIDGFEWTRNVTISELDAPNVFAWDVYDGPDERPQSRWRLELAADGDRTVLTQRFAHVPDGRSTIRALAEAGDPDEVIAERTEMLREGTRRTLDAIREASEGT
jgi:ligand-binding SRPBCC domain-containing protein